MACPNCGAKIEREKRVHYRAEGLSYFYGACGARNLPYNNIATHDKAKVTCLSCRRTKRYREAPE